MRNYIRQQGLKFQMVFWMTLISIISFSALFGFNFMYYKANLDSIQRMGVQSAAEIVSQSDMFEYMDDFITSGEINESVSILLEYKNELAEKVLLNGIAIFYQQEDELYQISTEYDYQTPLSSNPEIPEKVLSSCKDIFYTGQGKSDFVIIDDKSYFYYTQPVRIESKYKYGVCAYINNTLLELLLMRYVVVNVFSFIVVLAILDILVIYATNKVLIKPVVDMEKMVDSFVYQVSGGYATFSYKSIHGNELSILKNSLKRLEMMVSAHNKMMSASDSYSEWLRKHIDKLNTDNSILSYNLKSAQYEMLCDKEILAGNIVAWEKKCQELDHKIGADNIQFLHFVYLKLDETINEKEFIEGLMEQLGIMKGIPMESVFRLDKKDFLFIFVKDDQMSEILKYIGEQPVKIGQAFYIPQKTQSAEEMLGLCLNEVIQ